MPGIVASSTTTLILNILPMAWNLYILDLRHSLAGRKAQRRYAKGDTKFTFWINLRLCYSVQRSSPETFPALSRFRGFQPIRGYELLLTRHGCRSNRTMRPEPLPLSNGSDSSLHR